jgi:uncharacterized protein YbaP (TraB family)
MSKGLVLLLVMMVAVSPAEAAPFKCRDAAGKPTVQDQPCGPAAVSQSFIVPPAAAGRHLLWKVVGPRGSAYLLGSIHFGRPDMFPLPVEMTQAYAASQALVVETNLTALEPARMAQIVAAKAMYGDGTTLSQTLTPETWKQLNQVMAQFGASAQLLQRQKPWFVSMTLTSLALKRFGFDEELGLDNHFMKLAYKKKPIIELETFQQQLDFLDGFSNAEQEEMLKETFQDIEKGQSFLSDTLRAWRAGDAQRLDELLNEEFRNSSATDERMYQVLIAERNVAMADKLERLLNQGGRYFVVLGSAHFVGKDGIVELLKAKGYRVQQN